jgi:hypothetical protein
MFKRMALGLLLALGCSLAQAQNAPVQQVPSRLDATGGVASAVGAVNTAETATITVPAGLYAYITAIGIEACENATGTAANLLTFTSTNLQGSPTWLFSVTGAEICYRIFEPYATPLKSATAGTNVTIVSPVATATVGFGIRAYYYLAP